MSASHLCFTPMGFTERLPGQVMQSQPPLVVDLELLNTEVVYVFEGVVVIGSVVLAKAKTRCYL